MRQYGDPWELIRQAKLKDLIPFVESESSDVAAVMLSKLDVARAAELLGKLPGDKARRITYAVSQTGSVSPAAVDRIGLALAAQLHDVPETAFAQGAVERVGAILNSSPAATRDDVLIGLDEADQDFTTLVRRAIFTFVHIPERVNAVDIPRVIREVDQPVLVTALAAASAGALAPVAEFILENMSKRMAETIREEVQEFGRVKGRDGEEAMTAVVNAVRTLEAGG